LIVVKLLNILLILFGRALFSSANEIALTNEEQPSTEESFQAPRAEKKSLRNQHKRIGKFRRKDNLSSILFPGTLPEYYTEGEDIPMWVDLVTSQKTQVPFKYYDLPVCKTANEIGSNKLRKNLGQKLQGYQKQEAPYQIKTKIEVPCKIWCVQTLSSKDLKWLRALIERHYRIHMNVDGLPVLMRSSELNYAVRGYPVGFKAPPSYTTLDKDEYFLYNHVKFILRYNEADNNSIKVVGFDAHPVSIVHSGENGEKTCSHEISPSNALKTFQPIRAKTEENSQESALRIMYSYEVSWEPSQIAWADRWDIYMVQSPDDEVHLFSILNSLMIVVLLTGAVATIMIRTLKKDIATYNEMQAMGASEGLEEEGGWKLMHGDVFRPPARFKLLLCVTVGTGVQITASFVLTLVCALCGFLSTMKKGQTLTSVILLYVLCGSVAGYVSARLDKFFECKNWKKTSILTAAGFPAVLVSMFLFLDVLLSFQGAATAVSIWTIMILFLLWLFVSTPLVFVGSYYGFSAKKIEAPARTNQIARIVPEIAWYLRFPFSFLIGGILPFGNVCIEVYFILGALWLHQIYYVMGFLFSVMVVLVLTSAEIAIVMCYLQLAAEDHLWWWRSFTNVASAGLYMFLYSIWYLATKLNLMGIVPTFVYVTYMLMISMALGLCCGSVGTLSCFWFTKTIYRALKVD